MLRKNLMLKTWLIVSVLAILWFYCAVDGGIRGQMFMQGLGEICMRALTSGFTFIFEAMKTAVGLQG